MWDVELGILTLGCLVSESKDRGSVTSLSSEFSLITEEPGGASSLTSDTVDPFSSQPQASSWSVWSTQSHNSLLFIYLYMFWIARRLAVSIHSRSKCCLHMMFDVSRNNRLNVAFRCALSTLKSALLFHTKWDIMVHSRAWPYHSQKTNHRQSCSFTRIVLARYSMWPDNIFLTLPESIVGGRTMF